MQRIVPDANAGCSLEQSCPGPQLEAFLKANAAKNYYVIAYINCSGGVKALCEVIVTSGNAIKIVNQAPADRPILASLAGKTVSIGIGGKLGEPRIDFDGSIRGAGGRSTPTGTSPRSPAACSASGTCSRSGRRCRRPSP